MNNVPLNDIDPLRARPARDHGPIMLAVAIVAALLMVRVLASGIPNGGDGVNHYQHARQFWHHAAAALSQWGKPVFSLLASPFAAMGLWGVTLFDALCAVATCGVIMACIPHAKQRIWWWWVPVLLLSTPVLVGTLLRGLTEPLFGLASVVVVLLLQRRKHAWAMVVTSFLPFVRPEYAAFAPFAIGVVLVRKDFKALPWALLGVVLYSALSGALLGSPLAFFNEHTYAGVDVYGKGDPWLFVDNINDMYGLPLKTVLLVAVALFGLLLWRDQAGRRTHVLVASLTMMPVLAIFALHSYAWAHGGLGSLGLLRVMATTVPLIVLFIVHVLSAGWMLFVPLRQWTGWACAAALLLYGHAGIRQLTDNGPLLLPEDEVQRVEKEVVAYVVEHRSPGQRLISPDPVIILLSGVDPWDPTQTLRIAAKGGVLLPEGAKEDDWIIWDAHFAANEGGIPLDSLDDDPRFRSMKVFEPRIPLTTLGGGPFSIHVFQRTAGDRMRADSLLYTLGAADGSWPAEKEYPLTLGDPPMGPKDLEDVHLVMQVALEGLARTDSVFLVLAETDSVEGTVYQSVRMKEGTQKVLMRVNTSALSRKLYLWNTTKRAGHVARFDVVRRGWRRRT